MANNNKNLTKEKETKEMETEVKNQEVKEVEATEVVDPEEMEIEDVPVEKGFKKWVADKKAKHPRVARGAKRVVMVLGLIAAGMVGKEIGEKIQEKKDADLLQDAIDNGDLVRANDEMLAEANEMLDETEV